MTDTIKCTLHTVTYSFAQDTDDFFNDATNELSTAGGYTAGGVTLGTKSCGCGDDVAGAVERRERAVDVGDVHRAAGGGLGRHGWCVFDGSDADEHQLRCRPDRVSSGRSRSRGRLTVSGR